MHARKHEKASHQHHTPGQETPECSRASPPQSEGRGRQGVRHGGKAPPVCSTPCLCKKCKRCTPGQGVQHVCQLASAAPELRERSHPSCGSCSGNDAAAQTPTMGARPAAAGRLPASAIQTTKTALQRTGKHSGAKKCDMPPNVRTHAATTARVQHDRCRRGFRVNSKP